MPSTSNGIEETGFTYLVVKPCGCIVACMVERNDWESRRGVQDFSRIAHAKDYILKRMPNDEATPLIKERFHSEGNCPHMPTQESLF